MLVGDGCCGPSLGGTGVDGEFGAGAVVVDGVGPGVVGGVMGMLDISSIFFMPPIDFILDGRSRKKTSNETGVPEP